MTIGVAVPCYSGHIGYITPLLDNIAQSTRKPEQVVISCSSSNEKGVQMFIYKDIHVRIWYSPERLNQATNRNRAASLLTTDLVTFIDADDLMHPKRLEFLCDVFEKRPDIAGVYHSYVHDHVSKRNDPFWEEPEINPLPYKIIKDPRSVGLRVECSTVEYPIHHAHVTLRRDVFARIRFNEDWNVYRLEDSVYGATLVENNVPLLYLNNQLTRYIFN
jgi:glycosyltransferase involved in cell wall biosynthesis